MSPGDLGSQTASQSQPVSSGHSPPFEGAERASGHGRGTGAAGCRGSRDPALLTQEQAEAAPREAAQGRGHDACFVRAGPPAARPAEV